MESLNSFLGIIASCLSIIGAIQTIRFTFRRQSQLLLLPSPPVVSSRQPRKFPRGWLILALLVVLGTISAFNTPDAGKCQGLEACDAAIARNPKDSTAWDGKGVALNALGRYEEAIEAYHQAIKLDPKNADVWYNKGIAFQDLKKYQDALKAYDRAAELGNETARASAIKLRDYLNSR